MIAAIVLAAGESRRMGRQKLLLPFGQHTVLEHIVNQVLRSRVDETIVVTGCDAAAVTEKIDGKPVVVVENPKYHEGMLCSIRCGLGAMHPEVEAFFVVLGDQPGISPVLMNTLIDAFHNVEKDIIVPQYQGSNGHPILIAEHYRKEIQTRFDDTGLRGLIHERPKAVCRLQVDAPAVLRDMDTPDDYKRELELRKE